MPPIALWDYSWDRSPLCSQVVEISRTAADTPSGGASLQSEDRRFFSAAAEGMVTLNRRPVGPIKRLGSQAGFRREGLEVGTLEHLFQTVRVVTGPDSRLKALLHSGLIPYLSPSGIDAFRSGELGRLLDLKGAREKFRNQRRIRVTST